MRHARSRWLVFLGLGLVLAAIVVAIIVTHPPKVTVMLDNTSHDPLRDVRMEVRGDELGTAQLRAGATIACRLEPRTESDVVVSWLDASGAQRRERLDVYLEHGYTGTIHCRLDDAGRFTFDSDIDLPP